MSSTMNQNWRFFAIRGLYKMDITSSGGSDGDHVTPDSRKWGWTTKIKTYLWVLLFSLFNFPILRWHFEHKQGNKKWKKWLKINFRYLHFLFITPLKSASFDANAFFIYFYKIPVEPKKGTTRRCQMILK